MSASSHLLISTALGQKGHRAPVWVMRQAGRILPEYLAIRNSLRDFKELVETPHLAAEVTVQPVDILGTDAAIIFSDILVVPEAMDLPYNMVEKKGPSFDRTIKTLEDIHLLNTKDIADRLSYVTEAIKITKKALSGRVPLIGFAGAPLTIFTYMVEGGGSKTFSKARGFLFKNPEAAHILLQKITDVTIQYLKLQIAAGADLVQLFDSWAGTYNPAHYSEFGMRYNNQIVSAITEAPTTIFAKGAFFALPELGQSQANVIGLDWHTSADQALSNGCQNKVLQGNLDPCALYGSFKDIEKATKQMLSSFGSQPHIANLGHGVYPDTSADKVKCFIETVKAHYFSKAEAV
ncbi:MAG: uroporphyrinogen decarboxylase [Cytophagales bacterium]|nr:MAG: uroporphyrinogen decarboxylase [Cytophagales bacterium]TAF59341.1 MAG: uroporphyrinogen decarboxylase [Cytophagales bacterium]